MSTCGSEFLNLVNNILKPLSRFRELGIAVFRGFTNLRILLILNCVYNANNVFLYAGLMMWYQMFEYAIGHWLQKATEHMIGCVLCSPGCFSLFRGNFVFSSGNIFIGHQRVSSVTCNTEDFHCLFFSSLKISYSDPIFFVSGKALMDDNVMAKYTTKSSQARHYVQYDQGECAERVLRLASKISSARKRDACARHNCSLISSYLSSQTLTPYFTRFLSMLQGNFTSAFSHRRRSMAVHAPSAARLPRRVLGRLRRLHPRPRRLQRVLQPAPSVGALDHGQHHGSAPGLQEDDRSQRQHLPSVYFLPGEEVDSKKRRCYGRDTFEK